MTNKEEIKGLVERWLAGDTTLAEEHTLANYFAQGEVDGDLAWAAALFGRNAQSRNAQPSTPIVSKVNKPHRSTLLTTLVATVSVAAAVALGLFVVNHNQHQSCGFINGQMVCDASLMMESAAPVFDRLRCSLEPLNKTRNTLSSVKSSTDKAVEIINKYNIEKLLQQ